VSRSLLIAILASAALLGIASCSAPAETTGESVQSLEGDFDRGTLIIDTDDGLQHELDVYLAISFEQQRRGLMFVRKMPTTTGMLFVYEDTDIHSMWMKNTYISLDILFIKADGTVSSIARNTEPHSLATISAKEQLNFVLELTAGLTDKLGIESGSIVHFPTSN